MEAFRRVSETDLRLSTLWIVVMFSMAFFVTGSRSHGKSSGERHYDRLRRWRRFLASALLHDRNHWYVMEMLIDQAALAEIPNTTNPMATSGQGTESRFLGTPARRFFVGTSLFSLYDLLPDSPEFLQLSFGYRLTQSDALMLEAITWKYSAPTGIFESSGAKPVYPGYIKSDGISLAYQA
jgi:hypothetical protein